MAIVVGTRTSANSTSGAYTYDIDKQLKYIQNYQTPITQFFLSDKFGSKVTGGPRTKFLWKEKSPLSRTTTVPSGITGGSATASSVAVTDTIFRLGDTIYVEESGDVLRVTSDASGQSTIDLKETTGGNITTVSAGATIRITNSAVKEDYARQKSLTNNPDVKTGYCQIGLDAVAMSFREDSQDKDTTGEDSKALAREKYEEISKYEERKWLTNKEAYDDTSANITMSAGFRRVTSNVKYWSGGLDLTEIREIVQLVFAQQDTNELFAYCGSNYIAELDSVLTSKFTYNTDDVIKAFGGLSKTAGNPNLLKWMSPWGMVNFIWNPLLEGDTMTNAALFLNRKHVRMRYAKPNREGAGKFTVMENVQDPGTGAYLDQYKWDTGLETGPEIYHGWHFKQ